MEIQLDDVLNKVQFKTYSEAKQISEELDRLLLEKNLTDSQVEANSQEKDRDIVQLRKYLFDSICKYIKMRKEKIFNYIEYIIKTCLVLYKKDISNIVKEASLQPLIKIFKHYEAKQIQKYVKCDDIAVCFLDEIKLFKPSASVKGSIWYLLGLLTYQFPNEMDNYQLEIQDVMYNHLNEQFNSTKPEQKAIVGMLKGFRYALVRPHLTAKQVDNLYLIVKVGMTPIEDISRYKIMINSLRMVQHHHKLLKDHLLRDTKELFDKFLTLTSHSNRDVKENASESFEAFITEIAEGLNDETLQKENFSYLMKKFQAIIDNTSSDPISITVTIRAVGIFSKAMRVFLGEQNLKKFFSKLIELSTKVINTFKEGMKEEKDPKNPGIGGTFAFTGPTFKQVLAKQKQLNSFLISFAHLISNIKSISEKESTHLFDLALIGIQNHNNYFTGYRPALYDGIVTMIMALNYHQNIFQYWLKKFISQGMLETLKIPENVYYAGEDYQKSLQETCDLWINLLERPKVWSVSCCSSFFNEQISHVNDLINHLDLGYKMKYDAEKAEEVQTEMGYIKTTEYLPTNMNDSQYMYRICIFLDEYLRKCNKQWLEHFIPLLLRSIIYKLRAYPRCISLLKLLTVKKLFMTYLQTLNEIMEEHNFFTSQQGSQKDVQELCKMYYKELFEKYKEYQDELLDDCLKVLLSIPSHFILNDDSLMIKDLTLTIRRAFQIGLMNVYVAYAAINALTRLVSRLPKKKALPFLNFINPMLSDFMVYDENPSQMETPTIKFNLKIREISINKKSVCEKIISFLGQLGGGSHMLIPSEFRDQAIDKTLAKEFMDNKALVDTKKVNLIAWDHETSFTFPLPLFSKKIDIDLLKIIPRIVEIASNSTDRKLKLSACELLHSLIVYMIGKQAQQANNRNKGSQSKVSYSNLYSRIFPVIFRIAADPEDVSTKIFNTLCLQIVRWFSGNREYENKETATLLDTLVNCVSVKDNSNLRDFAAVCIGEFVKWCIKQISPEQMKEHYGNIKSVIRRIQNNSNHPDIYYRYGSVLAIRQIIISLREEGSLVEKYLIEITHTVLNIIKMSAHSQINTEEMKQNTSLVITKLREVLIKQWTLLEKEHDKRGAFSSIYTFTDWLFTQLLSFESDYREKCLYIWEGLIDEMVKKGKAFSHRDWILNQSNGKALMKECKVIEFDASSFVGDDIREKIELMRKNYKLLDSQIYVYNTVLGKGYVKIDDFKKYSDLQIFVKNVQSFLPKMFELRSMLSQVEEILAKDPQLFKTKLTTLLHLFTFLACSNSLQHLLQLFMTNTLTRQELYSIIFKLLISPFEGMEVNPNYNEKVEKWRTTTCCNLLKKLKSTEKDGLTDDDRFFETYFVKKFLRENDKFDLSKRNSHLLENLLIYTEFQVRSFFNGYDCLYENLFDILNNYNIRNGYIGNHLNQTCEIMLAYIERNLDGLDPNQEEKILILLNFCLKFCPSEDFLLGLINEEKLVFQKFQGEILDCVAKKWQFDHRELTHKILNHSLKEGLMNRLLIPLVQRVLKLKPNLLFTVSDVIRELNFIGTPSEVINTFTKFFYVLLSKVPKQKFFQKDAPFRRYLQNFILQNLDPKKHELKVILEVLNLLGLYIFELGNDYPTYHPDIVNALEFIQSRYYPLHTADLQPDSADDSNFKIVLTGIMNMIKMGGRVELLKVLYPFLRERECAGKYEKIITNFCKDWVHSLLSLDQSEQVKIFLTIFNIYLDRFADEELVNNIRWQIMRRLGYLILEELPVPAVEEILIEHGIKLEDTVTRDTFRSCLNNYENTIIAMQEKIVASNIFEIVYRRVPADTLKNKISKRIYGESSTKELHKNLIMTLHNAKRKPLENKDFMLNHDTNKKTPFDPIAREYHSASFNALCSIILATQTKEGSFNTFIMQISREKGDQLWELLLEKKEDFSFEVETNFGTEFLEKSEQLLKKSLTNLTLNNIIASKYLGESFFSQKSDHHGFLIMEFDSPSKKRDSDLSLEVIEEERMSITSLKSEKKEINPLDIDFEGAASNPAPTEKKPLKKLELDPINQHPSMKVMIRVIEYLHSNFPGQTSMPQWMTGLHSEVIRHDCPLFIKLFIIKLILNRDEIFRPHAKQWSEVLMNYCASKATGGKGFHYFLRDVCTTLLAWHSNGFVIEESLNNKKQCSEILTNLWKVACDKNPILFKSNLKIIAGLMDKWKKNLFLDREILQKMASFDEKKDDAKLWRMAALQVLDVALNLQIPVAKKESFQQNDPVAQWDDQLVAAVLRNLHFPRDVPLVTSVVLGKLLNYLQLLAKGGTALFNNGQRNMTAEERLKDIENLVTKTLLSESVKEPDKFALYVENIALAYPNVVGDKNIFFKITNKIHNLNKKYRGALFSALGMFIDKAPNLLAIQNEIRDICLSLQGSLDKITADYDADNLVNFFKLLHQLVTLNSEHTRNLVSETIHSLAKTFMNTSNEEIVDIFFNIITFIYDQYDDELKDLTKSFLLKGLSHSLPAIRTKVFDFLNHENRISLNPAARLLITMKDLYAPESENAWLKSTVPLMVSIGKKSSDYERKLFDFPLERSIEFKDFDPTLLSQHRTLNKSQPIIPIYTLSQNKIDEMIAEPSRKTLKVPGVTQANSNNNFGGQVRATQVPMFSQTLVSNIMEDEENEMGFSYSQAPGRGAMGPPNSKGQQQSGGVSGLLDNYSTSSTLSGTQIAGSRKKRQSGGEFGKFLSVNNFNIYNVSALDENKIRYLGEQKQSDEVRKIKEKQAQLYMQRRDEIRRNQVTATRKYRIGELPDIEITYKDIIDPLVLLASEDTEISSEIFICIVNHLHRNEENPSTAKEYLDGLRSILVRSKVYDHNVISTIHRAYLEVIKRNSEVPLDFAVIANSGLRSFSYHTTVLLLEEILIGTSDMVNDADRLKKMKKSQPQARNKRGTGRNINQIEFKEEQGSLWIHLIELYTQLNEDDVVKGLLTIVTNDTLVRDALDTKLNLKFEKSLQTFNHFLDEYEKSADMTSQFQKKIQEYVNDERTDCLAALGKWKEILGVLKYSVISQGNTIQIGTLKDRDAFYLVKALLNIDDYWSTMNDYVLTWRENERSKELVDRKYAWEMGLLAVTQRDFDRAKYFLDMEIKSFLKQWQKFNMFSEAAKHEQLQHLQKITEFGEFLEYIDKTKVAEQSDIHKEFIALTERWINRLPSTTFDSVHTWNDLHFGREMFCNLISFRDYQENPLEVELKVADFYVETAKGLLKKGVLENAETLLSRAIKIKGDPKHAATRVFDYKSMSAVIKLKLRILEEDEERFSEKFVKFHEKYNQILQVLEGQQKRFEGKINDFNKNRLFMLKILTKEKNLTYLSEIEFLLRDLIEDNVGLPTTMAENAKSINDYYNQIFQSTYFTLASMNSGDTDAVGYRGKVYHKYAVFADKILRMQEESLKNGPALVNAFTKASNIFVQKNLAKTFMTYLCDAFNLGYYKHEQLPKLFDMLSRYPDLAALFKEKSKNIPVWLFLKWLPQMMFLVNMKELAHNVEEIFIKLVETYPQGVLYQFNCTFDKLFKLENTAVPTELAQKIQEKLDKYQNHYAFIQSLNQLTNPEHKLIHYYFDKIKEALLDPTIDKNTQLKLIARELQTDVFSLKKPFIGDQCGSYNKQFTSIWEKDFIKLFGEDLGKVATMDWNKYINDKNIQTFMKKLKEAPIPSGYEKLDKFSKWLSSYDANNYIYESKIEIPGQYDGNSEPFLPAHITISNFGQNLLVLGSIRRPKRLTMHGSNEKSYNFLVKGIEDLRLDQRIEQLYSLMNEIFLVDDDCQKRELNINTFQVIPMTKMLGVLEWVDNTQPLKNLLNGELERSCGYKFDENPALKMRGDWLKSFPDGREKSYAELHTHILQMDEKTVVDNFNNHQSQIPGMILKKSLERLCSSPEAFLNVKNKFIRNYATLSIGSYILGVGDRHLENFLVSTSTGQVVPIDFGYSFGQGLTLSVPELMPFRLTRVFECLMQPMGVDGIFRNTMIYSLHALRKSRNVILDCCEIFVKDPLMDWIKTAKSKRLMNSNMSGYSSGSISAPSSGDGSLGSLGSEDIIWYPKKKIDTVKEKLIGVKPAKIMLDELQDSKYFKTGTFKRHRERIEEVVNGTEGTFRKTLDKDYLSVAEQVDALIDQARDPNMLGRTWIGWSPYV